MRLGPCRAAAQTYLFSEIDPVLKSRKNPRMKHALMGEFIDYETSMITDEDPRQGLLFC